MSLFAGQNKHLGEKIQRVSNILGDNLLSTIHKASNPTKEMVTPTYSQVRGFVEHVGLYVGLAVYTLAGAKVI